MKADFSNWSHSPDNFVILKKYAETAIIDGLTFKKIPSVVWRDGQFTLTLSPLEGEQVYEIGIIDPCLVEEPSLGFEPVPDEEEEEIVEVVKVKKKKPTTPL